MKSILVLAIALSLLTVGCKDFPGADGRYATPARGGWDNFRASAPFHEYHYVATAIRLHY